MMMEELPEAQGALIHIRDEMLAAPDTPTCTSRSGPAMIISPGYSAQRAGDLVPMRDSDGDSDDDYDGDHEEFERLMQQDYPENGSYSDSEDECDGESGAVGAAGAVGGSDSEEEQEQRLNSTKRRRKSSWK